MPFGPRKSGIPDSVEMPAPVSATTNAASRSHPATTSSSIWSTLAIGERGYVRRGGGGPPPPPPPAPPPPHGGGGGGGGVVGGRAREGGGGGCGSASEGWRADHRL